MRKDIFIVGARLLGIWQLLGAVSSLAYLISSWLGYIRPQSYSQEYTSLHLVVQLVTGLYLLFRTHHLFYALDCLKPQEVATAGDGETDINEME